MALEALGAHIQRGSRQAGCLLGRVHQRPGNPEVPKFEQPPSLSTLDQENVFGFHITMKDPPFVHILQRETQLQRPVKDLGFGKLRTYQRAPEVGAWCLALYRKKGAKWVANHLHLALAVSRLRQKGHRHRRSR